MDGKAALTIQEASPQKIATEPARKVGMTPAWWRALSSSFEGLSSSLCLYFSIETEEGVEVRRVWSREGGTDLERANFDGWVDQAVSALNPPLGVNPLDYFCEELRKDQVENNPDYRPGGQEIEFHKNLTIGEEEKKKYRVGLAKWSKAQRHAEALINDALLNKTLEIVPRVGAMEQAIMDKTVELAPSYGVPAKVIHAMQNAKYLVTRATCPIPNPGQAAAAFCSRLARSTHLEAEAMGVGAENQDEPAEVPEGPTGKQEEQLASPNYTSERNTWQKKLADPDKYPWMTISETMQALGGCSDKTVYRYLEEGKDEGRAVLERYSTVKPIRVKTESVKRLLAERSEEIA